VMIITPVLPAQNLMIGTMVFLVIKIWDHVGVLSGSKEELMLLCGIPKIGVYNVLMMMFLYKDLNFGQDVLKILGGNQELKEQFVMEKWEHAGLMNGLPEELMLKIMDGKDMEFSVQIMISTG